MKLAITLSVLKDSFIKKGMRILKVQQMGAKTADECSSFGDDSNPIAGMIAIFAETSVSGEPVIIGYINKNQIAEKGEKRLYSLTSDGQLSSYVWLKNNGQVQLNGSENSLTKFEPLKQGLENFKELVNAELLKIQTAITTVGGAYIPTPTQLNISNAEAEDLKCK